MRKIIYIFIFVYSLKNTLYLSAISSRMLIPTTELGRFDCMVMPFELEAYDILKSRSCKQKLISEQHGQQQNAVVMK